MNAGRKWGQFSFLLSKYKLTWPTSTLDLYILPKCLDRLFSKTFDDAIIKKFKQFAEVLAIS